MEQLLFFLLPRICVSHDNGYHFLQLIFFPVTAFCSSILHTTGFSFLCIWNIYYSDCFFFFFLIFFFSSFFSFFDLRSQ